ncbi:hypothetical protein MN116_001316 [Schistosoma mekongi]|uniref:Uncharacterized protein n=1 Tax=Schistosoma mekongi TaxID=38744 RepID=A0AAE2D942_SCHME|nr:hypothetical protein MN116_001316 [Schistosoma mekongi]
MSASESCKKSLVALESYLKDEHTNSETLKFAAISVLLIDGKKPNPLEEVEILDTIATYMMIKNEEDVKYRLFFEVFPVDKDISAESLYFLVKLSSLAICLGLSPLLEIVSLWLKDKLARCWSRTEAGNLETRGSSVYNFPMLQEATKNPPPLIISCITHWLRLSRTSKQHQNGASPAISWTSIDWPSAARRYKCLSQSRLSVDLILMSQLPPPLCLLWWTVFEPLRHIARSPCKTGKENCCKLISDYISDLHYEVLQCLSEPSSLTAYRHGSGIPGGSGFSTWLFTCSRKMEYTKEFYYLESIITQVHEQCSLIDSASKSCTSDKQIDPLELMVIRLAEFMHISWISGRIRNLSLGTVLLCIGSALNKITTDSIIIYMRIMVSFRNVRYREWFTPLDDDGDCKA